MVDDRYLLHASFVLLDGLLGIVLRVIGGCLRRLHVHQFTNDALVLLGRRVVGIDDKDPADFAQRKIVFARGKVAAGLFEVLNLETVKSLLALVCVERCGKTYGSGGRWLNRYRLAH